VLGGGVGRDGGQQGHPDHDGHDRSDVARADALAQRARPEHEQEDQAERERRLDDGQRGKQQRGGVQRPAQEPERRPCQPERPVQEPRDERRPQAVLSRRLAGLERLQGDADVVERRGAARGGRTKRD